MKVIAPSFIPEHVRETSFLDIELSEKEPSSFVTEVLPSPVGSPTYSMFKFPLTKPLLVGVKNFFPVKPPTQLE